MKATERPRRTSAGKPANANATTGKETLGTRERILDAAVTIVIEQGTARATTLEVQRRAGVSRGALLHHFPTHADLLSATVEGLVKRNEEAVLASLAKLEGTRDVVERAIRVLAIASVQPAYLAELELWAVSRTDPDLRATLAEAERRARKDSERVLKTLFEASDSSPMQASVIAMTIEFLRGLALSGVLRGSPVRRQQLIGQWIQATKLLLETTP
ncbi:TetR/AcrR family transcriptional regulator [Cupriavidus nantongensis]|uniref:TetR family transcriptional regulator n=1 Tax=Cupriavidus nantongensis TaxID=1796606 RepID=A0A142JRJ6_9BURK|nr:TetR/AcrR family transcriptional regulator [Cupriavidus nantongensis]AMR80708.1 TetR family transcriptional regulator [Cupriavidus nantongensis]